MTQDQELNKSLSVKLRKVRDAITERKISIDALQTTEVQTNSLIDQMRILSNLRQPAQLMIIDIANPQEGLLINFLEHKDAILEIAEKDLHVKINFVLNSEH